jgi:uncharacterized FlgJ-related protein
MTSAKGAMSRIKDMIKEKNINVKENQQTSSPVHVVEQVHAIPQPVPV